MNVSPGDVLGGWCVEQILTFKEPYLAHAYREDAWETRATLQISDGSPGAEERHRYAAMVQQAVDHPRLPKLLESVSADGCTFTAYRPFSGEALSDRFVSGGMEWQQAVTTLHGIATALQALHRAGWSHRNLSPECIFVGQRDAVWVLGLEHAAHPDQPDNAGLPRDTALAYVAPEVLRDAEHDPRRADLYSLGLVAYELLSGEAAFPAAAWVDRADHERTLLEWKTRAQALDPGPDQPDWLRSMVAACTHPLPDHRMPDIDMVVAFLEAARTSWEMPAIEGTPVAVDRSELPPLHLQPSLPLEQLEALRQTQDTQYRLQQTVVVSTAVLSGFVAGPAVAFLLIVLVELSRLA